MKTLLPRLFKSHLAVTAKAGRVVRKLKLAKALFKSSSQLTLLKGSRKGKVLVRNHLIVLSSYRPNFFLRQ